MVNTNYQGSSFNKMPKFTLTKLQVIISAILISSIINIYKVNSRLLLKKSSRKDKRKKIFH